MSDFDLSLSGTIVLPDRIIDAGYVAVAAGQRDPWEPAELGSVASEDDEYDEDDDGRDEPAANNTRTVEENPAWI